MTYYEILEVSEEASEEVIRVAYKALARKYHPDVFAGDSQIADSKMKQINEAYEVLSNPEKRKLYNKFLKDHRQTSRNQSVSTNVPPSGTKESSNRNEFQFPKTGRSAVVMATCFFLIFAEILNPYIENTELYDYALVFCFRDISLVSLILMIVPVIVGTVKKNISYKGIKRLCAINSIAIFVLSFAIYVAELTVTMGIGWILAVLYYFVNKHILCQIQENNTSSKTGIMIAVLLVACILLAIVICCTAYINQLAENDFTVNQSEITSELTPKDEPNTAFIFEKRFYHDCVAPLEIITTGDEGYYFVVDLVSLPETLELNSVSKEYFELSSQIVFYVRGGDSIKIDIPLGTYEIYYATGDTWYGEENLFGNDTIYQKCDSQFVFSEDANGYNGWTVKLQSVSNGNLGTEIIDRSEFPM